VADIWLAWCVQRPVYGKGNGPFGSGLPLGWVLHVNESNGNLDGFFAGDQQVNPSSVCPNFQVYKDGTVHQHLPLLFSPWCQVDGNATYCAVETEGYATEPLTPQQVTALARLHNAYHTFAGIPDAMAIKPGDRGIGVHSMGGAAWGGHSCPGPIRDGQRVAIIQTAQTIRQPASVAPPTPQPSKGASDMVVVQDSESAARPAVAVVAGKAVLIHDGAVVLAFRTAGVPVVEVPSAFFTELLTALGGTVG
jgi:hypothetical protein